MSWTQKQHSILGVVAMASFMATFLISSVNIALPAIEADFDLDAVTLSWVVTSFLLSTAMFLLPVGRWGDMTGIRKLFKWGVVVFTLASVLCGLAPSGFWLIVFRFVQGVGGALTSTTGPAILVKEFSPQSRGRVLGISVSAVYVGLAMGPFLGGFLTQFLGWRSIFFVAFALGVIALIVGFLFLGKDQVAENTEDRRVDLKGTLFYMGGLVSLGYGSARIPELLGWTLMGCGSLFLFVFWLFESRSQWPVFNTRLFTRNRLFAFSNLAALINYSATFAIVFLLSLFLQKVQGYSPRQAGMILIAQPVMMALFSPWAGRLSDRVQPRFLTTLGMGMCMLGLVGFAFLTPASPQGVIVGLLVWEGLGFALFSSPNMNTIMSAVNPGQYGLASGSAATMRVVGQMVSMTIATLIFSWLFGTQRVEAVPTTLFLKAMKWAFLSFSLVGGAGIYFSFYRGSLNR